MIRKKFALVMFTLLILGGLLGGVAVFADQEGPIQGNVTERIAGQKSDNEVAGANATIKITDDMVHVRVNTKGLMPGHTYTLWWEIFLDDARALIMWTMYALRSHLLKLDDPQPQ